MSSTTTQPPQIIAHRGNKSVAPENTMPAFAAAIAAGAQSIEMDIVRSREGIAVIVHDDTLDATTSGEGPVADYFVEEIQEFDAGSWFSPAFAGTQVPTFAQFAQFMAGHPEVEILLEFKGDWDEDQTRAVIETIDQFGVRDQTIIQSFNQITVESHAAVAPEMRRGLLFISKEARARLNQSAESVDGYSLDDFDALVAQCAQAGIYTINPFIEDVFHSPYIVERIQAAGIKTQVWTANSPDQWDRLTELGVDAIITDRPDTLSGWYAGRGFSAR